MIFLTLLSILIFAAAIICAIIALIKRLFKKNAKVLRRVYLIGFGLSIALLIVSLIPLPSGTKEVYGENYAPTVQTECDFEIADGSEPLEVIKSDGLDRDSSSVLSKYYRIFDSCDLHYVLENCNATKEDCLKAIESNTEIDVKFKDYFCDFIERIANTYPETELSILCYNLETLKVYEVEKSDYILKSFSVDSYGCYIPRENAIYIPIGTEYIEGEWGFQVLVHEFCHAARISWREDEEGGKEKIQFCSNYDNTILEEAMNSVFSCSLLNYYERDIAYQVPSNYLRIMLECMDNYELSDYLNHSDTYFLSKLDEYTGYTNYAQVIWNLITLQRSDWEEDSIDIPTEDYEPIYSYLCDMYYGKYITSEMSDEECLQVAADLVDKAFYDAPEDYKINNDYFYDYLNEYLSEIR